MTEFSKHILENFQIRKTRKQKAAFRDALTEELRRLGYTVTVEKGFAARNVVAGDPDGAEVLLTAYYDTCPRLPFPNFITPRNMLWYILYQFVLIIPMGVLAIGAEVGTILLWEILFGTDCPVLLAMAALYLVLYLFLDGPANKHTANDNTSGVVTLLEIAAALPEEERGKVCFVFFDNEEKGLFGSAAFVKAHKTAKKRALVLNFDCVGDGDSIQFYPAKPLKRDAALTARLTAAFPAAGGKTAEVVTGFGFYPSDQKHFAKGVGVCALKKNRIFGYYMDRIHTKRDTVLEEENVRFLRDGVLRYLGAKR